MTAAEVGWSDPGADPPHEWEHTRTRLEEAECALAGMVSENNELRAIIRRVREYAQSLHLLADVTREAGGDYVAKLHDEAACAIELLIGDAP
ncbi:hypothetical protein [Rhodococcus sp. Chr-9]|uniref:hypothetical protein n=1 Tax=Rhodococcus sp. Chr-9 TaxID=713612 RepID=UPI000575922B|nr:hypothetical protein [Rhodococcus sp. Chr-9]KHJ74671.1 hypothetical protein QR64_00360 [Rhodococcus sp. Chr-9]